MIVLYVSLALVLLVTFLLFLNISFVFEYKEEFDFKIKILFVTLNADKLAGNKENSVKEKTTTIKKKRKKSISEKIDVIKDIVDLIKAVFGELLKYARLKVCYLDLKVATDDAAKPALTYGAVSSAVYTAIEFLDSFVNVKKSYKKINIYPDFSETSAKVNLKIIISIKSIHLLLSAMHLLPMLAGKQKGK